ncbi:hypothetical protein BKA67DRAFT_656874 [Truncatella angustata]|uniref:GmrSD restriction endonucleases C-terminal domain-containing protein n=1 Tax=Truncatella angustata TaxID=152316 RepID=A0A9P9A3A5_9PEZI|nr:uncharacterized protein BKA67DRAFT_656874 [Truncatella angustata]KAH6658730.1 hypothetical protein BKA67DRAFT_656874 [Truncatella angustata]KAH8203487.1 hypothetical protein TruAng_002358 [Truncatella angustata]
MRFIIFAAGLLSGCAVIASPVPDPVAEPLPMPSPSGIPSAATAKTQLAGLTVAASVSGDDYDRDLFPTWITISGTCDTREYVLKRDATSITVDSACKATAGKWTSPYDGASWTAASDLDIDHMVPLKNAWISGANAWTTAKRQQYANDVVRPQLWAVTDNVNESKSDKSPDQWKPPLSSFYCVYARAWVQVKSYWELTITSAEKTALTSMLGTC